MPFFRTRIIRILSYGRTMVGTRGRRVIAIATSLRGGVEIEE